MRLTAILLLAGAALAEPRWAMLNHAARDAVNTKDYAKLRETLLELRPFMPGSPTLAYNLAASEAVLGNREAALAAVRNLAAMGLVYDLNADNDFASLRDSEGYRAAVRRMEDNKKPVSKATPAFVLSGRDLIPEDIAWDALSRRFFVSSVRKAEIVTADGKAFAHAPWSVLALAVDEKRQTLWATTAWIPHCESCAASDKDKTALLAFDLKTGRLKQRIDSPLPGLLGDMTISRGGDIYVSEGLNGAVLLLRAGAKTLERLDEAGEFPSPQTPALSADEKTLYVPDYARGIAAMDVATRKVQWLTPGPGIALTGIDGLYVHGDSFLAVQNGTTPARIVRWPLDLSSQEVLEANTPGLGEPTHGTFVGDTFYFLANTGWSSYDGAGKKKEGSAPVESAVRQVNVERRGSARESPRL